MPWNDTAWLVLPSVPLLSLCHALLLCSSSARLGLNNANICRHVVCGIRGIVRGLRRDPGPRPCVDTAFGPGHSDISVRARISTYAFTGTHDLTSAQILLNEHRPLRIFIGGKFLTDPTALTMNRLGQLACSSRARLPPRYTAACGYCVTTRRLAPSKLCSAGHQDCEATAATPATAKLFSWTKAPPAACV